jgi:hypothetical protein
MAKYQRSEHQQKILDALDKVYDSLIEFKKRTHSELVIIQDNRIVRFRP